LVNYGGNGATVTAVPDPAYMFLQWSDNSLSGAIRTDWNVTHNISATASFGIAMISVPPGMFTMGNGGWGDDLPSQSDELPQHQESLTGYLIVTAISPYKIGTYDVTNQQYADILNWASPSGDLTDSSGAAYTDGDVYAAGQLLLAVNDPHCQVTHANGVFGVRTRDGYSMAAHPVVCVTWYGAAMYCNWLSESQGLVPCYDTTTWTCNMVPGGIHNGYHLPTEAQWERAAAWDASLSQHRIYGFKSDWLFTLPLHGGDRCNYYIGSNVYVNPLGLTSEPFTSPVGWFNGLNISPNGGVQTVDSPSPVGPNPVGCYDMSGNVWQWCNDWYDDIYYQTCQTLGMVSDPTGPLSGTNRVTRGGGWNNSGYECRSARRYSFAPNYAGHSIGFRLSRF
jgi:formylglycine-generating enzyme required for sulfatase activity